MSRLVSVVSVATAIALSSLAAGAAQQSVHPPPPSPPADSPGPQGSNNRNWHETEHEVQQGRVSDYVRRHGENGRIDAEDLLRRTRAFVNAQHEGGGGGFAPFAINGSVWNAIGPSNGAGRATAIAIDPSAQAGSTPTVLIGAAGGGVWRTTNNGVTWTPLTDGIPNLSVGALAYAPSNPSMIYLGTGEGGGAIDMIPGIGLLVSTDGGANWTLPASVLSQAIYRISVNPSNALDLVVGTRDGAFRSTHGATGPWTNVITSGIGQVTDIVRDPTNAQVLYAAINSYGGGGSIRKSTDGGSTWAGSSSGLPVSSGNFYVSRMGLAIAPSAPQTLYVAFSTDDGVNATQSHIYKTTNGGGSWSETNLSSIEQSSRNYLRDQAWYGNTLVVSRTDPNVVTAGGVWYVSTTDGGATWSVAFQNDSIHVDVHDLRYDANDQLWIANDGGIWTLSNGTMSDRTTGLVTRQFYAIAVDPSAGSLTIGGTQDNGTERRPASGGTSWDLVSGGDGFQCVIDQNPAIALTTIQYGWVYRTMNLGDLYPSLQRVTPPYGSESAPFFTLLTTGAASAPALYTSTYRLWKSTTYGDAWIPLPTTTTDGSTWNNWFIGAIGTSPGDPQVLMVSQCSDVFRSTNGGTSWVHSSVPGCVTSLAISPTNSSLAYATQSYPNAPVYYTTNGGASWSSRSSGLPAFPAQMIRFDPTDSNVLYCGTDVGVYRSTDGGASWSRFGSGMPAVAVYDLGFTADGAVLRAATHGRGMWELAVTASGNHRPVVSASAVTSTTITRGSSATLTGSFSDADGDPLTAKWLFPDVWNTSAATNGAQITRTFGVPGTFPVTLTATDSHSASSSATVSVAVRDPANECATPLVVPASGPFPYTVSLNPAGATWQNTDPVPSCTGWVSTPMWLSFTPSVSGYYYFSLCGSSGPGSIAGYTGNACGPYSENGLCEFESQPAPCSSTGYVGVPLTAQQTVRLSVDSYWQIPLTLTISNSGIGADPTVNACAPSGSSTAGGAQVVIKGSGFAAGATVTFGGTAAAGVTVVDAGTLTATAPAHAAGDVAVAVSVPGRRTATLANAFSYIQSPAVTAGATLYVVTPCRLIDTRNPNGPQGGPSLSANAVRNVSATGICGIPAGAHAIAVNATAVSAASNGWLTLFAGPAGVGVPFTSTLSYASGKTLANFGIVPLGSDGTVNVYNSGPYGIHFILDVTGYFQ